MSPEQAAGERTIDGRSDLYSLGILGYQMLTGEPPFIANSTPAILVKHISERPIPVEQRRADVPQDLARVIMMLLEKDPANRFPSAQRRRRGARHGHACRACERRRRRSPPEQRTDARSRRHVEPVSRRRARKIMYGAEWTDAPTSAPRWNALGSRVVKFRRKLAPYLFVNGVIVDRVDRRATATSSASPCSGASISRSSTRSCGPTATIGATCSASRATAT